MKNKRLEFFTLLIFIVTSIIVSVFHEPWFDEAQAWQIAKCASYKDIILYIPHYEGHPPLWTFILSIPAKLGVPYEIGLKTVGLTISFINAYLIIFRSPFPKIVRLLLPFNFFLFYQYGVIVRPYGLMILSLLILAVLFPSKDTHPWRFTGILMLLCLTHAYGIMIAGGIAVCIVWDLLQEKGFKGFLSSIFKDQRIIALEVLLVLALLVIIDILPKDDTYNASVEATNSLLSRLLCMLFTMIPDCLFFKSEWFSQDASLLKYANISSASLISACLVGILVWIFLWFLSSKANFKYLIVPYCSFAIFGAVVYMVAHHIGVSLGILMSWVWISLEDKNRFENWNRLQNRLNINPFESKITRNGIVLIGALCLLVPIYWTALSSVKDIKEEYGYGRGLSAFIKENNLEKLNIYAAWDSKCLSEAINEELDNELFVGADSTYLAYFDENILNNVPNREWSFRVYKIYNQLEAKNLAKSWSEMDAPDLIIGDVESSYNGNICSLDEYTIIYMAYAHYYYKDGSSSVAFPVYMRNELLDEYGFEKVNTSGVWLSRYTITDEMREAYENGEMTLEDIMDATIGDLGKTDSSD